MKHILKMTTLFAVLILLQACESKDETKSSCTLNDVSIKCEKELNQTNENTSEFEINSTSQESHSLELSQSLNSTLSYKKGNYKFNQDLDFKDSSSEDNLTSSIDSFILRGTTLKVIEDESQRVKMIEISELILAGKNLGKVRLIETSQNTFEYTMNSTKGAIKTIDSISIQLIDMPKSDESQERDIAATILVRNVTTKYSEK